MAVIRSEVLSEACRVVFVVVRAAVDHRLKVELPLFEESGVRFAPTVFQHDFGGFHQ